MGFIKSALGMIGNAATGGLASGIGGLVSGLFGGGTSVKDQKKIMAEQAKYEKENMKYQSELNEAMAQANQQRAYDYFNMTANYNSAKNQKARLEEAGLNPALMYGQAGSGYFERNDWKNNIYKKGETKETYVYRNGTRAMMPRYYRDKIYTEDEKEYLWIEKLDKGITWVMGQKCKIDSKEYEEALKYYQLRARQLHGNALS